MLYPFKSKENSEKNHYISAPGVCFSNQYGLIIKLFLHMAQNCILKLQYAPGEINRHIETFLSRFSSVADV